MLADFYIPTLSNDMKIVVHKNNLVGQILYISLVPSKKRRLTNISQKQIIWNFHYFSFARQPAVTSVVPPIELNYFQ